MDCKTCEEAIWKGFEKTHKWPLCKILGENLPMAECHCPVDGIRDDCPKNQNLFLEVK